MTFCCQSDTKQEALHVTCNVTVLPQTVVPSCVVKLHLWWRTLFSNCCQSPVSVIPFWVGRRGFCLFWSVHIDFGTRQTKGNFPGHISRDANITASTAEGKNMWSYSSAPPYAFKECTGTSLHYFTTFHPPCIYQIKKYINNQQKYLWCVLSTMFSPISFGRYCCHLQGDDIITRIQVWLTVTMSQLSKCVLLYSCNNIVALKMAVISAETYWWEHWG